MKYIVNVSGGLASAEALRRTIEQKGIENTIAVFADVRGDPAVDIHAAPAGSNWDGEDEDVYRFLNDTERLLGVPIQRIKHSSGIGVWGAIFRERAISIRTAAGTFAPCTKLLKMETLDAFHARYRNSVAVLGLGWQEAHRIEKHEARASGAWYPMNEPPFVDNCHIARWFEAQGVKPPASYEEGFPHANCGGACIKAGISQWVLLLKTKPERFAYNEQQETQFRCEINGDVAILRSRKGGTTRPLPLQELRERVEAGEKFDRFSWGGCGCFAPAVRHQTTMKEFE